MLVKDPDNALKKLVALMNKNGMAQHRNLPEERSEAVKKLASLSGPDFDQKFIDMMVAAHLKAVDTFQREANSAQNSDVRDYAKDVRPRCKST
jgi:uncharacterized protein (DUF305 family)